MLPRYQHYIIQAIETERHENVAEDPFLEKVLLMRFFVCSVFFRKLWRGRYATPSLDSM